jgi:biopolymer transport protein ExbB/TolQ
MQLDLSLRSLFVHGGFILALLLAASVWSWVLIVERWLAYRRAEAGSDRLSARVAKLARAGQIPEARELAQAEEGSLSRVLLAGLAHPSRERATLDEALDRKQAEELMELERNLGTLGTLGSIAPYVGLFGTVLGIIRSFQTLGQGGADAAGAAMVSAGIAESLVATAAGLAVAVPAVVFFNNFSRRLTVLETRLALGSSELVEALTDKSRRGGADAEA